MAGLCFCFFFALVLFFSPPLRSDRGRFSRLLFFFSSLSLLLFVFLGCSDGMEREACVCDHGFERSDLCAEIIIIIIIIIKHDSRAGTGLCTKRLLREHYYSTTMITVLLCQFLFVDLRYNILV